MTPRKMLFENIMEEGENAGNHQFPLQVTSILSVSHNFFHSPQKQILHNFSHFYLSSINALNSNRSQTSFVPH